jgi:hypothetical protein
MLGRTEEGAGGDIATWWAGDPAVGVTGKRTTVCTGVLGRADGARVFLLGGTFLRDGVASFKGTMGVSRLGNSANASSSALHF